MNPNIAGIISLVIFSTGTLLMLLAKSIPPFALSSIMLALGFVSISCVQYMRERSLQQFITQWKQPLKYYILVVSGVVGYNVFMITAFNVTENESEAFAVNMINYLWPIMIYGFSAYFLGRKIELLHIMGFALGLVGLFLVMAAGYISATDLALELGTFSWNWAYISALLAAFLWAFYSAKSKAHSYASGFVGPVMCIGSVVMGAFHFIFEPKISAIEYPVIIAAILLGLSRCSYYLWDYAIRKGDAILLSSLSNLVPLVSSLLFIVFGFRPASYITAIGGALIIAGCLITNWKVIKTELLRLKTRRGCSDIN